MKQILLFVLFSLITLSCGKGNTNEKTENLSEYEGISDKKLCELLTKEMMASITGIKFNEEMVTLHQTDPGSGKYVSQCGYYLDGGNIGVLVRRFGNEKFSKTREGLIGGKETGDAELDSIMHSAVATSKAVNDLGDAAYFFDLGGIINLIVVFQDHYQIQISCFGKNFGFDDNTLQLSRKVAEEVIKILKSS
ncbi:MAG: hypothetical protein N3D80_12085 [Ignavibacterium album]|uniref:Lipoprotein n=1 Tax=Ignavibacterium album TaxID=591197 RepID=A0A7V2ZJJ9_9BACT|nr:hypothetical protein [Ignavibacterium album]MCX8106596.1 hypothetical protein [Ignavibacterium album]